MTRVVDGIYSDVELETGFFISDREADIIGGWLENYAAALEKNWVRNGSVGDPKKEKFAKVRSFKTAIERKRTSEGK